MVPIQAGHAVQQLLVDSNVRTSQGRDIQIPMPRSTPSGEKGGDQRWQQGP